MITGKISRAPDYRGTGEKYCPTTSVFKGIGIPFLLPELPTGLSRINFMAEDDDPVWEKASRWI
jgi:hypothetical protein